MEKLISTEIEELRINLDSIIKDKQSLIQTNERTLLSQTKDIASKEKTLKDKEYQIGSLFSKIKQDYYYIILLIFLLILMIAILRFAIIQRKRAIKSKELSDKLAAMSEFKANIWQEFGHVPSTAISEAYYRLEDEGVNHISIEPLVKLQKLLNGLFQSLQMSSDNIGVGINKELTLAKDYITYVGSVKEKNIDFEIIGKVPEISIPPAILFSCTRNAINHGGLLKKEIAKIAIEIEQSDTGIYCYIHDNGNGFPPDVKTISDIKSGTGLKNANSILRYHVNGKKGKNYITFGRSNAQGYTNQIKLAIS